MANTTEDTAQANTTAATYLQLISKDEKQVKVEGLTIKAQEASLEVSREIMNLKSSIAKKTTELEASKRQIPYDVRSEYKLTNELQELNNRLEFAQAIKSERFSDANI